MKTDPITPEAIRALRKALGLSQSAFAARLGVSQVQVSRIETGEREPGGALRVLLRGMLEAGQAGE